MGTTKMDLAGCIDMYICIEIHTTHTHMCVTIITKGKEAIDLSGGGHEEFEGVYLGRVERGKKGGSGIILFQLKYINKNKTK